MANPIALCFADSHLDPLIWKARRDIQGDSFAAFEWLIRTAIKLQVPVFIAGDVLEMQKPPSSVVAFLTRMHALCRKHGISVHFIQGQHDRTDPPWLTAAGRTGFHHINRNQVEVQGQRIFALDWHTRAGLLEAFETHAEQIRDCDVLMLHQVWYDLMGGIRTGEVSAKDIPEGPQVVFTGDYHRSERLLLTNKAEQEFQLISPGSTHLRSATEPTDKSYYLLHDDGSWVSKKIKAVRPTAVYSLRSDDACEYMRTRLTEVAATLHQRAQALPASIRRPLVVARYHPNFYEQASSMQELADELQLHYLMRASQSGLNTQTDYVGDSVEDQDISPESTRVRAGVSIQDRIRENLTDDPLAQEILLRTIAFLEDPAEAREELNMLRSEYMAKATQDSKVVLGAYEMESTEFESEGVFDDFEDD